MKKLVVILFNYNKDTIYLKYIKDKVLKLKGIDNYENTVRIWNTCMRDFDEKI